MKAECLVAETSAVQMVVMAGTYGNNDNVPKVTGTLQKEEKLFGGNGGNDKANRKPLQPLLWNALWLFIKNPL